MKTLASYCSMRLWKWIFVALIFVSFLLGSAYYSIGSSYIMYINDTNKMINPVERNELEYRGQFRSNVYDNTEVTSAQSSVYSTTSEQVADKNKDYWKEFQKKNGNLAGKNRNELRTNNVTTKFDVTTNYIAGKYKENINNKQTRNDKDETENIPSANSNHNEKTEAYISSTTPSVNKFEETNERGIVDVIKDNVDVNKDNDDVKEENVNKPFNEKNATPRKIIAFTRHQAGTKKDSQNTDLLDGTMGSSIKENKYNRRKSGHTSPAKFKGRSGVKRTFPVRRRRISDIHVGPDNDYAIPDLESLRINKTLNTTFVLLVTYARSGSTWLGAITNQAKQTFYVYEPLQMFIKQGYYKENLVCYNNNTCRKPRVFTETHNFAVTTLHRLFTCQFTKLHPRSISIFIRNLRSQQHASTYKSCMNVFGSTKKCLQRLESICSTTTHRILKAIRISMELVNTMMDMWPNLKVVHLVRDPRGITSSRRSSGIFTMSRQLVSHSHDMCDRMSEDVEFDTVLNKKYFNRLKLVFYESLAEMPLEGAKFIYRFLNMTLTDDVIAWVYNSTHAEKMSGYFGTMRSDSAESAYKWRTRFTLIQIKIIDNICKSIYKTLGFIPLNSSSDLRNSSIPSRRSVKNINWFS